jgi:hypothetical protein
MLKKLSAAVAFSVVFVFLAVSIVHACADVASVNRIAQQSFMNIDGTNQPCHSEESDFCKSVRDSILSLKPSTPGIESPEQRAIPLLLPVEDANLVASSPINHITQGAFHPVFKLPLPFSYLVLRI